MGTFKRIILEIDNLKKCHNLCNYAKRNHTINLVIGESGFGKTISHDIYGKYNKDNTIRIIIQKSSTIRSFYSDIYNKISNEKNDPNLPLNLMIRRIANQFNSKGKDLLLLVDEVTKFEHNFFEHLQDFWELTNRSTGIVLSGCDYFKARFEKWNKISKNGMPEFYSRIDNWVILDPPTKEEIVAIIRAYEIFDSAFEKSCFTVKNFRELVDDRIRKYLILKKRITEGEFQFSEEQY